MEIRVTISDLTVRAGVLLVAAAWLGSAAALGSNNTHRQDRLLSVFRLAPSRNNESIS